MPSKTRKRENRKKKRNPDQFLTMEHKYYIFCEGEKTEPLYFDGLDDNTLYEFDIDSIHLKKSGAYLKNVGIEIELLSQYYNKIIRIRAAK